MDKNEREKKKNTTSKHTERERVNKTEPQYTTANEYAV